MRLSAAAIGANSRLQISPRLSSAKAAAMARWWVAVIRLCVVEDLPGLADAALELVSAAAAAQVGVAL